MQPAFDGIEPLITGFCNQYLNEEYRELCLHLLEKLCRKKPSPLLAGRKNTWAAAIIYAITTNNFIFDKSQPIHLTADELCAPFGLAKSTVSNKAREIRDMFNITYLNPEWQLTCLAEDNPAIWLFNVNGFVIDIRMAPVDVQEEAYRRGLIPFVPACRKETEEKEKLNHHCQKKKSDRKNKSSQKVLLTFRIYTSPLALNRKSNRHGFIQ